MNNPTGNVLVTRDQIVPLLKRFPKSLFWIDEAYVQYVDPEHRRFSDLVAKFVNLVVVTFSFAYGLAGVRIGYMLAPPSLVREMSGQLTNYRLGTLQENSPSRPSVTVTTCRGCARSAHGAEAPPRWHGRLRGHRGLGHRGQLRLRTIHRRTDRRGNSRRMAERGIATKCFEPFHGVTYDPYFRITLGTREENAFFLEQMAEVLKVF